MLIGNGWQRRRRKKGVPQTLSLESCWVETLCVQVFVFQIVFTYTHHTHIRPQWILWLGIKFSYIISILLLQNSRLERLQLWNCLFMQMTAECLLTHKAEESKGKEWETHHLVIALMRQEERKWAVTCKMSQLTLCYYFSYFILDTERTGSKGDFCCKTDLVFLRVLHWKFWETCLRTPVCGASNAKNSSFPELENMRCVRVSGVCDPLAARQIIKQNK